MKNPKKLEWNRFLLGISFSLTFTMSHPLVPLVASRDCVHMNPLHRNPSCCPTFYIVLFLYLNCCGKTLVTGNVKGERVKGLGVVGWKVKTIVNDVTISISNFPLRMWRVYIKKLFPSISMMMVMGRVLVLWFTIRTSFQPPLCCVSHCTKLAILKPLQLHRSLSIGAEFLWGRWVPIYTIYLKVLCKSDEKIALDT